MLHNHLNEISHLRSEYQNLSSSYFDNITGITLNRSSFLDIIWIFNYILHVRLSLWVQFEFVLWSFVYVRRPYKGSANITEISHERVIIRKEIILSIKQKSCQIVLLTIFILYDDTVNYFLKRIFFLVAWSKEATTVCLPNTQRNNLKKKKITFRFSHFIFH